MRETVVDIGGRRLQGMKPSSILSIFTVFSVSVSIICFEKTFSTNMPKCYIFVYFKFHTEKFVQPCMNNELG